MKLISLSLAFGNWCVLSRQLITFLSAIAFERNFKTRQNEIYVLMLDLIPINRISWPMKIGKLAVLLSLFFYSIWLTQWWRWLKGVWNIISNYNYIFLLYIINCKYQINIILKGEREILNEGGFIFSIKSKRLKNIFIRIINYILLGKFTSR